jgi:deoxyribose-phosphate aldolase
MSHTYSNENVFDKYPSSFEELKQRANRICSGISPESTGWKDIVKELTGFIDLTTLEGDDTTEKVNKLCEKGQLRKAGLPDVAAICIYPTLLFEAEKALRGTGIALASVAGGFPSGQTFTSVKCDEVRKAVEMGASEVDVVINRGMMLEERYGEVYEEVRQMKEAAGDSHLKVIIEISELASAELIRKASEICLLAGADFIKTSTGKSKHGATPEGFLIMADTIKEYHEKTGKKVGIKAAGGIRKIEDALCYYALVRETPGADWLSPALFRIGASSLLDSILSEA